MKNNKTLLFSKSILICTAMVLLAFQVFAGGIAILVAMILSHLLEIIFTFDDTFFARLTEVGFSVESTDVVLFYIVCIIIPVLIFLSRS